MSESLSHYDGKTVEFRIKDGDAIHFGSGRLDVAGTIVVIDGSGWIGSTLYSIQLTLTPDQIKLLTPSTANPKVFDFELWEVPARDG